jgi:two-component system nitrate/nitrite response regulator NarL
LGAVTQEAIVRNLDVASKVRNLDVASLDVASKVLSPREREVGLLVVRGLTNKEAANQLGVSAGTVKVHVHNILRKLGANSRYCLTGSHPNQPQIPTSRNSSARS